MGWRRDQVFFEAGAAIDDAIDQEQEKDSQHQVHPEKTNQRKPDISC